MCDNKEFTLREVWHKGREILEKSGIPDADFDSLCLMEHFFGVDRTTLILHGDRRAAGDACRRFFSEVEQRAQGRPLQYIIGMWNFMGYDFYVGDGVLIPRADTEIAAQKAVELARRYKSARVIDLCSGSGAIAVTIAKLVPEASVIALELSESAFGYMQKNIAYNQADNVTAVKGDVLCDHDKFPDNSFDMIVSNPPYIRTEQIDTLQRELSFEPRLALDGGADGLYFYRAITENWKHKLRNHGVLVYETGEEQHEPVCAFMKANGFADTGYVLDLQGYKRVTYGFVNK
ncbi:MAG: peptide chain release factor N(5)-glutamine methyltransferase [Clostridia bacterium]|nr:peptide chain release factor N(5)-glutamine methyltransferase [Clostridia bacterium]